MDLNLDFYLYFPHLVSNLGAVRCKYPLDSRDFLKIGAWMAARFLGRK